MQLICVETWAVLFSHAQQVMTILRNADVVKRLNVDLELIVVRAAIMRRY